MGLREKILDRSAKVGVLGLGYVGLPLAVEFAKAGFRVFGIDVDADRVSRILAGNSYIQDVPAKVLGELVSSRKLTATTDYSVLEEIDAVSICVPTPLRKTRDPDIQYIADATAKIRTYLHAEIGPDLGRGVGDVLDVGIPGLAQRRGDANADGVDLLEHRVVGR